MSNPSAKRPRTPAPPRQPPKYRQPPPNSLYGTKTFEPVDPRWIVKALALTVGAAVLCAYIFICILFSRSQWQLVLHPSRIVSSTPVALGLAFTEIHFDDDASGQPQLDGWWIPAAPAADPTALDSDPTVLLLHSGSGSMGDALPAARDLHDARLSVLLFDYRGYGRSAGQHPTEASMEADSDAALRYLADTRHVPFSRLVVYGAGAGGPLAVRLCAQHSNIAALILQSPDGDFGPRVRRDQRSGLLPVGLLFHEDFPLAAPLRTLRTPKLLLSNTGAPAHFDLMQVANPKMSVELPQSSGADLHESLRRFLDAYLPQSLPPKS